MKTQDSVINIDKLTYAGRLENLRQFEDHERYAFEQVDICDKNELTRVFQAYQPDAVMHLAAESHVDRSIERAATFIETNIVGTYTLLEAALCYWQGIDDHRQRSFRFHHISTDEVFGDLSHPLDLADADRYLSTESSAYAPSSPYSATKASSDHLVRAWMRTYGLPVIVTNCTNNYGPFQFPEKLIPLMILNALEGRTLPVYGKGDQIRDWLYVDDHVTALYKVCTEGKVGETYNISGHNEKQNIEVVRIICNILDELLPINENHNVNKEQLVSEYGDLIVFTADRPGHDRRYAMDSSKIQRELGWQPAETFDSGIHKTVDWYIKNSEWCRRIQNNNNPNRACGKLSNKISLKAQL